MFQLLFHCREFLCNILIDLLYFSNLFSLLLWMFYFISLIELVLQCKPIFLNLQLFLLLQFETFYFCFMPEFLFFKLVVPIRYLFRQPFFLHLLSADGRLLNVPHKLSEVRQCILAQHCIFLCRSCFFWSMCSSCRYNGLLSTKGRTLSVESSISFNDWRYRLLLCSDGWSFGQIWDEGFLNLEFCHIFMTGLWFSTLLNEVVIYPPLFAHRMHGRSWY